MKKILLFLALLCVVLTMDVSVSLSQDRKKTGGTLIFGRGSDSVTLDPARFNESESGKVARCVFEGLVKFDESLTDVEPSLATSWEISGDGKEYTFHLRKGVLFHDGTPFNADAVVTSFSRQIDTKHAYYQEDFRLSRHTFNYVNRIEAVDDYTVRISLERAFVPFLNILAIAAASFIVSPKALEKHGDDFGKNPVGTGPFRFVKWEPGDRIILERNDQYWGNKPCLDKLVFVSIRDNKNRLLALKTAAIHAMDGIDPGMISGMKMERQLQLQTRDGHNVAYLAMNTEKRPFDVLKVRQAINYAINKENLVKLMYQGLAVPAKSPVPPAMWGYNDRIVDYEYSPAKARRLLKEAGYKKGFDTTLWAMSVARPYMPQPLKMAELIKNNLAAVNIRAKIVTYDMGTLLGKTANGEHDMYLGGWSGSNGDPNSFLYVLLDRDNAVKPRALNYALFKDAALHDLLTKAQHVSDKNTRIMLYQQAQEIIHQQAPWVPIAHNKQAVVSRKTVHDLVQLPTGVYRFENVWME